MKTFSAQFEKLKTESYNLVKEYCLVYRATLLGEHHRELPTPIVVKSVTYRYVSFNKHKDEITLYKYGSSAGHNLSISLNDNTELLCTIADNISNI